jgi:hypothetical protein
MTTYDQVAEAAKRLVTDDTKDTWALADAVLAHVPDGTGGKGFAYDPREGGVREALAELAEQMQADGVATPNGDPYTTSALDHLRETAMAWPKAERHNEAAYRTHQEAGSPKTMGGKALATLCAVARGEDVTRPRSILAAEWKTVCDRITARRKGWPVAANDVRIALQRKPNVPGPSRQITTEDVKDAIEAGEVDPSDVTNALTEEDLFGKLMEKRTTRHAQEHRAQFDSDEEAAEDEASMDDLHEAVKDMHTTLEDMESEYGGGPVGKAWAAAEKAAINAILLLRKQGYASDFEHTLVTKNVARLREALAVFDLYESGDGDIDAAAASIAEGAEDYLRSLGSN